MNQASTNPHTSCRVSVVIGAYNRKAFLKLTIESVREELAKYAIPAEIIVVDGGSDDGSLKWLMAQKDIITIVQHNRGEWNGQAIEKRSWGYFMNLGFKCAQGEYLCMLSDDCLLVPGAIRNGLAMFEEQRSTGEPLGAVPFYWRNWPKQDSYGVVLTYGNRYMVNHGLFLRAAAEKVGYIDEETYAFYHADSDFAQRICAAGYTIIPCENAFVEHYAHANLNLRQQNKEQERRDWQSYVDRWQHLGQPDTDWVELDFEDETRTANKFKQCNRRFF